MTPQFFLIAGPNGAGKSLNGRFHIPGSLSVFNGDLIFSELQLKYPHIEADRLAGGVTVALEKAREEAISLSKDFAFESNFSTDMANETTALFKTAGYHTSLIYFGLNNIAQSAQRVDARVALGGHDVDIKTIRFNFNEGIKRVNKYLGEFDHIRFVDTSKPFQAPVIAFSNKISGQLEIIDNSIDWFNKNFRQSLTTDFELNHNKYLPPQLER